MRAPQFHPLRWLIFFLSVAFYYYEYVLRVSPSVMVPQLEQSFGIAAGTVGTISAFYFFAYAPLQFPIGILMDRFGARKLLVFASTVCGLGGLAFGFAPQVWLAEGGRFLMGTGSAFAFIGMIYICHHWFPLHTVGLLIGIGNSIGMIGAVTGEGPISLGVAAWGWRAVAIGLGILGLLLALIMYIAMRREDRAHLVHAPEEHRWRQLLAQVKIVCLNPQTWINALGNMTFYATTVAFAGLWGVPFIQVAYQVDNSLAAFAASMIYVGFIVGGPLIGWISDRMGQEKVPLMATSLLTLFAFVPVLYLTFLPIEVVYGLLFLTGAFSAGTLLNFRFATSVNPQEAKGTAIAFTNTVAFIGGALFQTGIGYTLQAFWTGTQVDGITLYPLVGYQTVLTLFPATLIAAFILLKEPEHGRKRARS
ncbi:MAG: MFS transporter [Parachlamydiales bacterium]